eukprot:CAMPEP_0202965658 /NCGR_PEP_ID=MMETSP1396-20130829/9598_1 /ASSEMBLY_ACC=CAM_ASM_000872 /TAXON_ID= /ORGANISM="Pseudokeronopsis sp., Strain Brazil" /LENGTH=145 /DNA_ID=CAMNT_0049688493 /DNA_START=30 /DNA_END=466 /DNA_ORIENTATION=-
MKRRVKKTFMRDKRLNSQMVKSENVPPFPILKYYMPMKPPVFNDQNRCPIFADTSTRNYYPLISLPFLLSSLLSTVQMYNFYLSGAFWYAIGMSIPTFYLTLAFTDIKRRPEVHIVGIDLIRENEDDQSFHTIAIKVVSGEEEKI